MKPLRFLPVLLLAAAPAGAAEGPPLLPALENEFAAIAARALPSVVRIRAGANLEAPPPPPADPAGAVPVPAPQARRAFTRVITGFAWDREGHIVTVDALANAGGGQRTAYRVTVPGGKSLDARLVGHDAFTGLTVLQVAGAELPPLPAGDSTAVRAGAWAIAVAGTGDAMPAALPGTVAALDEGDFPGGQAIRIVGAAGAGGPGAPVLNARGELIGIVVAREGADMRPGAAHAMPVHLARPILEELCAGRTVRRGFLGVTVQELTAELAKAAGLEEGAGVFLRDVVADGPAAKAGVQAEDVALSVAGKPVRTPAQLTAAVGALPPGKEAALTVWRKGQKVDLKVVLGERPAPAPRAQLQDVQQVIRVLPGAQGQVQLQQLQPGQALVIQALAPANPDKPVTLDFQAAGFADALLRVLNGAGVAFRVAPDLLADEALARKPFGLKAQNTPLNQVLDQLAAHYGIRWRWEGGAASFERK